MPHIPTFLLVDLFFSMAAFALYGWDKAAARARRRRVPEHRLLLVALLGGWPGALLAQRLFRHKTRKHPFRRRFIAVCLLNLLLTLALIAR